MDDQEHLRNLTQLTLELSRALLAARAELDALRLLHMGLFAVVASDPDVETRLVQTLQAVFDADEVLWLNSELSDELLQERSKWLQRLTPTHLQERLRFP
ncbi:hypothetical protein [Pelomonas sp. KK5]|uniref:hypothetical protein n=1 Tax=Pelomonas sp. KK5 TaxID=1855730 RepID=UPI00097C4B63|nr:hypothetical protein [Pelomonas sp. KK5]